MLLGLVGVGLFSLTCVVPFGVAIVATRDLAHKSDCSNNLKLIGLALHNYRDDLNSFPPASYPAAGGRAPLSWRVRILQFTGRPDYLRPYDDSQPWDGSANRGWSRQHPLYECWYNARRGRTSYVAIVDRDTLMQANGTRPNDVWEKNLEKIIVVEVADSGIEWMEPRDLTLDQFIDKTLKSQPHPSCFHVLLANGAVQVVQVPDGATHQQLETLLRPMVTIEQ